MRNRLPLTALRTFEAAAHHGSFAKAAEELSVTPTAVSHQIKQLEDTLGILLFRRFPRPITLTHAGECLFPVLQRSFDDIANALGKLQQEQVHEPLIISTTNAFASRWLLPKLSLLKQHTGVELEMRATESISNLRMNEIDVAVRYCKEAPQGVEADLLAIDRFIAVASPDYLQQLRELQRPSATLIHYQWKIQSPNQPSWDKYLDELNQKQQSLPWLETDDLRVSEESHAIEAAIAGQGIALVSDVLIKPELDQGKLATVFDHALQGLSFYVIWPKHSLREKDIQTFLLWAREQVQG